MKPKSDISIRNLIIYFFSLVILSLSAGFGLNLLRGDPLPLKYQTKAERMQADVDLVTHAVKTRTETASDGYSNILKFDEFTRFLEEKRGLVLDARPEIFYRLGHIPGSVSLPRDDFAKVYLTLREKLEAKKAHPLVVYCSDEFCKDSELVKEALIALGFSQVFVFKEGWSKWQEHGRPEESQQ